jgi:hypothetical protein
LDATVSLEKKLLLLGGGAILFIILAGALGWLRGPASSESSPVTPSSATNVKSKDQLAKENKRFEQCRAKLKKAEKLDLLHDLTQRRALALRTNFLLFFSQTRATSR